MKVLITGNCGFIGTNLTKRCLDEGYDIIGVDNNLKDIDRAPKEVHDVTIYDDFSSDKILDLVKSEQFDAIFHEAAIPRVSYSMEHPAETTNDNVLKTVKLLEVAAGNCGRFVFASSSSIYGDNDKLPTEEKDSIGSRPKSPYALQKKVCEGFINLFCDEFGLSAINLRYFNCFGPHQYGDSAYATALSSWCHCIKEGLPIRSDGTGNQSRDLCYIDNVVEANILAAKAIGNFTGTPLNIACNARTSNNEIIEALRNRHDFKVNNAPFRAGDIMHTQANIDAAKKVIGYTPVVQFWDGFEMTLDWWGL